MPTPSHTASSTEPNKPTVGLADREPILIAVAVFLLFAFGVTALAIVDADAVAKTLGAIGTLITVAAGLWARTKVTPVADPKYDADTSLEPAIHR